MSRLLPFCLLLCLHLFSTAMRTTSADLTSAEFERLHRELRPGSDELWRTVPWNISLLDAQKAAGQQRKPIFIWAMDGHPLGCT